MRTYSEIARELSTKFELCKRDNGDEFYASKIEYADELRDFIRDCHSDGITNMLSDDHKYLFIVQSLDAIADTIGDDFPDFWDCLGDSYTSNHDLCLWLASNTSRYAYCDEATDRNGQAEDTMQTLRNGYDLERELVFNSVVNYLTALLEQEEENENEGETDIPCPICGAETEYRQRQGTHIWVCSECPMVMFEYYTEKDTHMLARELDGDQLVAKDVNIGIGDYSRAVDIYVNKEGNLELRGVLSVNYEMLDEELILTPVNE